MSAELAFDIEVSPNGYMVGFMNPETRDTWWIDDYDDIPRKRQKLMEWGGTLFGFNSESFDMPVLAAIFAGWSPLRVKELADTIINERLWAWSIYRKFGLRPTPIDHFDLREPAPSFVSLKAYGARMNSQRVQDLPYHHAAIWTPEMREEIRTYCVNDLVTTVELREALAGEIKLREQVGQQYKIDCRSLSDTQVAAAIFNKRLGLSRAKNRIPSSVVYKPPGYLDKAKHPQLIRLIMEMKNHVFQVNGRTGHVTLPEHLEKTREIFGGVFQPGVGGLHSQHDRRIAFVSDDEYKYFEVDAASFYPSILIQGGKYPGTLGPRFIEEYRQIYVTRLKAKQEGDTVTNESLKISLNGTFGLTAAKHSTLYDPSVMLYITLTGQLSLLQLIEWTTAAGATCVSANTDGVVLRIPAKQEEYVRSVVARYEQLTNYVFEWTPYKCIAFKDVNNYYAMTTDGKVKRKGLYAKPGLRKNATSPVCANAVATWLATGRDVAESVRDAPVADYLSARNVTGGGMQGGVFLGKVVRWYMSTDKTLPPLTYAKNGNKVPKTDGARACMEIKSYEVHPPDLDYDWYEAEALKIIYDIGADRFLGDMGRLEAAYAYLNKKAPWLTKRRKQK